MKRFDRVDEPDSWQEECVAPGRRWLDENRGAKTPPNFWSGKGRKFRRHLRDGLGGLCSYTVLLQPNGEMDHFRAWATLRGTPDEGMAYQWDNFRYSVDWFNKAKGTRTMPDPFAVEDDWFEVVLPSLELVATDKVPPELKGPVKNALQLLGRDQRAIDARQPWWDAFRRGGLALDELRRFAPLLARAVERLSPEDARTLGLPAQGAAS